MVGEDLKVVTRACRPTTINWSNFSEIMYASPISGRDGFGLTELVGQIPTVTKHPPI